MGKERLYDYDVMKAITILLVVYAHVTRMFTPKGAVEIAMGSESLTTLTNFIYMFHMPAFVTVTGAVYSFLRIEKGRYVDQRAFVKNKAARLLIPYLFFTVAVVLPSLLYIGFEDNALMFVIQNIFLLSGPRHLWYSVMIFNVFIVFNLFERKIRGTHFLSVAVLLVILYGISLKSPSYFQINGTLRYVLYFYLGYSFQKNRSELMRFVESKAISLLILLSTIVAFYLSDYFSYNLIMRLGFDFAGSILGTALLYLVSYRMASKKIGKNKLISSLANDSYGIFLFHPMIIYILFFWIREEVYHPYLTAFVIFFLSLLLSVLLVRVFRQLGMQVLIGENKNKKDEKTRVALKSTQ